MRRIELAQHLGQDPPREDVLVRIRAVRLPGTEPEDGVVLVVAAPERERGVVAQPLHDRDGLVPHPLLEVLVVLRILRAGEAEVLPDHHAVRIAPVPERLGLVEAAAPDADHVAVGLAHQLQRRDDPVLVPAVQRVHRHPARPADEAGLPVHRELHLAGLLRHGIVVRQFEVDFPDAELEIPPCNDLLRPAVAPDDVHVVEGGLAETARPPEVRLRQMKPHARRPVHDALHSLGGRLPVAGDRHGDLGVVEARERPLQAQVEQVARIARLRIQGQQCAVDVADPLGLPDVEAHVAEDAG